MRNEVVRLIDAGHVASQLDNAGAPRDDSTCKRDQQPWPCADMRRARERDARRRQREREG